MWARSEGETADIVPQVSSAGVSGYDRDIGRIEAGIDGLLHESGQGKLIGGVSAHYGSGGSSVASFHGGGEIDSRAYGMGGTLTWYGQNGFYADVQGRLNCFPAISLRPFSAISPAAMTASAMASASKPASALPSATTGR